MKEFFDRIDIFLEKGNFDLIVAAPFLVLLWLTTLYFIEKRARKSEKWKNVKAVILFLSSFSAFFVGLLWLGPEIIRLFGIEADSSFLVVIRASVGFLSLIANAFPFAFFELPYDEKERIAFEREIKKQELKKIREEIEKNDRLKFSNN